MLNACGRKLLAVAALTVAVLISGCGGGSASAPTEPATLTAGVATVGPVGGLVRGEDGVQITFPPKALTTDVTIRIAKDSTDAPPLPAVAKAAGAVYMITPHGGALAIHAQVSIPVERTDLGADEQIVLLTAQPGDSQWTVLSGAIFQNSAMQASVMHFSYFRAVSLSVPMPSLSLVVADKYWGGAGSPRTMYNNIGGAGVARFSADYEFGPGSIMEGGGPVVEARLTTPSSPPSARILDAPLPEPCVPVSYAHDALRLRFLRNGTETVYPTLSHLPMLSVAEAQYPRVESEVLSASEFAFGLFSYDIYRDFSPGMGAVHYYGADNPRRGPFQSNTANANDGWALPPAGNVASDDLLSWRGRFLVNGEQHNGSIRIDASIATTCGLVIEAIPVAFNLNLGATNRFYTAYQGVVPGYSEQGVGFGSTAEIYFADDSPGNTRSVTWEYSNDIVNWQRIPVPAQYIRDLGRPPAYLGSQVYKIVIPNVQPDKAGWYRAWTCLNEPAICFSKRATKLVILTAPPVVVRQPVAQIVQVGQTANFSVLPEYRSYDDQIYGRSGPLDATVQWQKRSLADAAFNGAPWVDIPGATDIYYTTPVTSANDSGMLFRAVLSTVVGNTASAAALLTVVERLEPPAVVAQPTSLNVIAGGTAVFVATLSGAAPLSYEWRRNGVSVRNGNSAVLTLNNVMTAMEGSYQLVVSNTVGSVTTAPATLVVSTSLVATAPTITTSPASISVGTGTSANFAVGVSGTGPYLYSWYKDGTAQPIAGANSAGYNIASATMADAGTYTVRVTNAVGSATSQAATLTIVPGGGVLVAPVIVTPPVGLAVLPGAGATFAVAVTGSAALTYQWRLNGADIAGATGAVLHIASATGADAGPYSVEVRNAAGMATSSAAPLIVVGAPSITGQPIAARAFEGQTARFVVAASGDGLGYLWTRDSVAIPGATAASYTTPALVLGDTGAVFAVVVYNGAGVAFSSTAVLTVTPTLVVAAWSTPVAVSPPGVRVDEPTAASARDGGATLAWVQYDAADGQYNGYASRYDIAANAWQSAELFETLASNTAAALGNGVYAPRIAMVANQRAHIAFGFSLQPGSFQTAMSRFVGTGWVAQTITGANNATDAALTFTADGTTAVMMYPQFDGASYSARSQVYRYDNTTLTTISPDGGLAPGSATRPAMAPLGSNEAVAVWTTAAANVWANRFSSATQSWATPVQLNPGANSNVYPVEVSANAAGTAVAVWLDLNAGYQVYASRMSAAGWTAPVALASQADGTVRNYNTDRSNVATGLDASGNGYFAWGQSDPLNSRLYQIRLRRCSIAQAMSSCDAVEVVDTQKAGAPALVVEPNGDLWVAWVSSLPMGAAEIRVRRRTAAGWSPVVVLGASAQTDVPPAIAVDGMNRVTVAWTGADQRIQVARWQ